MMYERMKTLRYLTILLLLAITAGCRRNNTSVEGEQVALAALHGDIYRELSAANRLTLATMSVTKTAIADDSKLWGKKIGVYSYDTYLRASVDLNKLTPEDLIFDDEAKTVTVTLPPVEVDLSGRDMTLREEYTNIGLLRSRFDSKERARAKEIANQDLKKELSANSSFSHILTQKAEAKARDYISSFFEANGYVAEVNFKQPIFIYNAKL